MATGMKFMRIWTTLTLTLLIAATTVGYAASDKATSASDSSANSAMAQVSISPGTVITTQNWQNYRGFMPDGMAALFEGKYFWKMPSDVQLEIAPTVLDPLPKNYLATTEKYSDQVRILELPDGGLTIQGYHGGIPFPNPQEPHKAWKVLANLWYRYTPDLLTVTGWDCAINSSGNSSCEAYQTVDRQLSYSTDSGVPSDTPPPDAKYFTQWFMVVAPEQSRYTAQLTIDYADLSKPEDVYVFLPSLRRYQPMATSGRCAQIGGEDWTAEDFRSGLDSNITQLQAEYLGHRKIIALQGVRAPEDPYPGQFFEPLTWPKPPWAKWQLRDVDVISVTKVPSRASGYCYGKRVMYVDSQFFGPLWEELYDKQMNVWKFATVIPQRVDVPGIGPVNTPGVDIELIWDIQRNHASAGGESTAHVAVNEQAPAEYQDLARYTTPAGLNLIMR